MFGPKKEDVCPNCGVACLATDILCPNCGKNLDDLFDQLPDKERPQSPNPLVLTVLIVIGISALCCIGSIGMSWVNGALLLSNPGPALTPASKETTATLHVPYTTAPDITPSFTSQETPSTIATSTFTDTALPASTFTPQPTGPTYAPLLGRIWSGVKVYYGLLPEKAYGFEIVGGSEDCPSMPSGRGVKVKFPNGKEEWKDRLYLVSSGLYFVTPDDPALSRLDWRIYSDCP